MSDAPARWGDFRQAAPEFAGAAERLLTQQHDLAYLATVAPDGTPRMAPVCPILASGALYLSIGTQTPKRRDLQRTGRYALHAMLGENDEELQIWGRASLIDDLLERERVHAAISFQYQADDPLFRLDVEHCLWVYWKNPGQPGTRAIRKRWP